MAVTQILPAYLYTQYADDEDVQAFISSYNTIAQQYLNTFNALGLPIYPNLSGPLLDWVSQGLYGFPRPIFATGYAHRVGPLATYQFADKVRVPLATSHIVGASTYYVASDDVYIRCLTWLFYKGDGAQFSLSWLRRRIGRFLYGAGESNGGFVNFNFDVGMMRYIHLTWTSAATLEIQILGTAPPLATQLKEGIDNGVLQLPFQYVYDVVI